MLTRKLPDAREKTILLKGKRNREVTFKKSPLRGCFISIFFFLLISTTYKGKTYNSQGTVQKT